MTDILVILLVIAIVKFFVFGGILYVVFREDIAQWWSQKEKEEAAPRTLVCPFCASKWTREVSQQEPRWEHGDLILATNHECLHCHYPIVTLERVRVGKVSS